MKIDPFALERYFARYEFSTRYLLSSSDCDGWAQTDILALADDEARGLWQGLRLGYTEPQGLPQLRREIAKLYSGIEPEQIVVAVPQEGVFLAMNCILEKGDHVVCTYPGYQSLYQVAESIGCAVDRWEPDERAGWAFDVDALIAKLRPKTKLVIVNFPHNPTGSLPSAKDFRRLIDVLRERGIYLFSDEMYRFLELDAAARLPSACDAYEKAVSLFGMSKTFGMAGIRVGWLVTRDKDLYRRFLEFKDYTTISSSAPSEVLALIGLRAKDAIIAKHRERIARNLDVLDAFFRRHAGSFSWIRPRAGTVGFPGLLLSEGIDGFCERMIRKAEVMLLPSTVYGYPRPHFRIGFGRENLPEVLGRLEEAL